MKPPRPIVCLLLALAWAQATLAQTTRPVIYDTTGSNLPGTVPARWAPKFIVDPYAPRTSVEGVQRFARALSAGEAKWQAWSWQEDLSLPRVLCLDFEGEPAERRAELFAAFRAAAPQLRVVTYNDPVGELVPSHEYAIAYANTRDPSYAAAKAWIETHAAQPAIGVIAANADAISGDVYLNYKAYVERDLRYPKAVVSLIRKLFPGKGAYLWVSGEWVTSPELDVFDDALTHRYAKALLDAKPDGIVVWQGRPGANVKLLPALLLLHR